MTKLRVFAHQTEALIAKSLLESHGIRAEVIGAKEYSTHVLGGDFGHYTLVVSQDNLARAQKIIDEIMAKDMPLVKPPERINHFKKGVVFALLAPILIPVYFNYISLRHAWTYWENSRQDRTDRLKVALIVLLNIPTPFIVWGALSVMGEINAQLLKSIGGHF